MKMMKKYIIHAGFHPEIQRVYNGEYIYKVVKIRRNIEGKDFHTGSKLNSETTFLGLDNGGWIKDLGNDRYVTDWTNEERWGRVEEVEFGENNEVVDRKDVGFVLLRVDRAHGVL